MAMDWRKQLRVNEKKSKLVILSFIMIHAAIGLAFDAHIIGNIYRISPINSLQLICSGQTVPIVTLILSGLAILAIIVTFVFHDRLILLGSKYQEVTSSKSISDEALKLYHIVEELRIASNLGYTPKVYLIDADYMNAFASGYSEKSALIAVTKGLLNKLDRNELQAVIAHELSHIKHQDVKLTLLVSILGNLSIMFLDMIFRSLLFNNQRSKRKSRDSNRGGGGEVIFLLIIAMLRILLPLITTLLILYLSRKREFMADAGAVALIRENIFLARALIKIKEDHLANQKVYEALYRSTPNEGIRRELYIFDPKQLGIKATQALTILFSTHPPLEERLKALNWKG